MIIMRKRELTSAEAAQVYGGWLYDGHREWLQGYNIVCPYCQNERKDVVIFKAALGPSCATFRCEHCRRSFSYHYQSDKIWRFDDHGRGI